MVVCPKCRESAEFVSHHGITMRIEVDVDRAVKVVNGALKLGDITTDVDPFLASKIESDAINQVRHSPVTTLECEVCGWEGHRSELVRLGLDNEPLPKVSDQQEKFTV